MKQRAETAPPILTLDPEVSAMSKNAFAMLVLGTCAGAACAQSAVTVYGSMDLGMVYESGGPAGSSWNVESGVQAGSRLGFKGSENLGNGLSANFVIEGGIAGDTGGNRPTGLTFGRQTLVGLSGPFGSVKLGRQFNLVTYALNDVDPFGGGHEGAYSNVMFSDYRTSNGLYYTTPAINGLTANLTWAPGEVAGSSAAKREIGYAVEYARGRLFAVLAHRSLNNLADTSTHKVTFAGATYDFGPFKAALGYARNKDDIALDSRDVIVGASTTRGADSWMVSLIDHKDSSGLRQDARQAAIGYTHALSKRTNLYSSYSRLRNDNGAPFTVGNAVESGSGTRGLALGLYHKF
ncbi:porin [Janthinobacterium sp. BJB412]|nr:porin [Janthinobacterium sp. BJB412]